MGYLSDKAKREQERFRKQRQKESVSKIGGINRPRVPWDPKLHPRDMFGRFAESLNADLSDLIVDPDLAVAELEAVVEGINQRERQGREAMNRRRAGTDVAAIEPGARAGRGVPVREPDETIPSIIPPGVEFRGFGDIKIQGRFGDTVDPEPMKRLVRTRRNQIADAIGEGRSSGLQNEEVFAWAPALGQNPKRSKEFMLDVWVRDSESGAVRYAGQVKVRAKRRKNAAVLWEFGKFRRVDPNAKEKIEERRAKLAEQARIREEEKEREANEAARKDFAERERAERIENVAAEAEQILFDADKPEREAIAVDIADAGRAYRGAIAALLPTKVDLVSEDKISPARKVLRDVRRGFKDERDFMRRLADMSKKLDEYDKAIQRGRAKGLEGDELWDYAGVHANYAQDALTDLKMNLDDMRAIADMHVGTDTDFGHTALADALEDFSELDVWQHGYLTNTMYEGPRSLTDEELQTLLAEISRVHNVIREHNDGVVSDDNIKKLKELSAADDPEINFEAVDALRKARDAYNGVQDRVIAAGLPNRDPEVLRRGGYDPGDRNLVLVGSGDDPVEAIINALKNRGLTAEAAKLQSDYDEARKLIMPGPDEFFPGRAIPAGATMAGEDMPIAQSPIKDVTVLIGEGISYAMKGELEDGTKVIVKTAGEGGQGQAQKYGIPEGQDHSREWMAGQIAEMMGVPAPSVGVRALTPEERDMISMERRAADAPVSDPADLERVSVQNMLKGEVANVAGDGSETTEEDIELAALFDAVTGQTDRHTNNFWFNDDGKMHVIDNGLCLSENEFEWVNDTFMSMAKGRTIRPEHMEILQDLKDRKSELLKMFKAAGLSSAAATNMFRRIELLLKDGVHPGPSIVAGEHNVRDGYAYGVVALSELVDSMLGG